VRREIEEKVQELRGAAAAQDLKKLNQIPKEIMVLTAEKSKLESELKLQQEKESSSLADASNAAEKTGTFAHEIDTTYKSSITILASKHRWLL
jgi:hypothetical protein